MAERKYTKDLLEKAVRESTSYTEVCRKIGVNLCGGSVGLISHRIKEYGLSTSHFRHPGSDQSWKKKKLSEILVKRTSGKREKTGHLRRGLLENNVEYKCAECYLLPIWNGKSLVLQIDHIDGNPLNDELTNLRFLCPNCHTQTKTFGFKKRL